MRVGIDILDTGRFAGATRERLAKIFSKRELDYFERKGINLDIGIQTDGKNGAHETVGGVFCAKEAFFKALGTGVTPSNILEVELLHDMHGAPYYKISPRLTTQHKFLSTAKITVSISHTKTIAVAVCIISSFNFG